VAHGGQGSGIALSADRFGRRGKAFGGMDQGEGLAALTLSARLTRGVQHAAMFRDVETRRIREIQRSGGGRRL